MTDEGLSAQQIRAVSIMENARRDFEAAALREEANPGNAASAETPVKPAAAPDAKAGTYEYAVEQEANRLRIHAAAVLALRQERAGAQPQPALTRLDVLLSEPDEPVAYRVDRLLPVGGRAVLAAQYKAGKTTARNNLVKVLADGGLFLGQFWTPAATGPVVVLDNELDPRMSRRWLRDVGVVHADRVVVASMRGAVASFDPLDEDNRARWADRIRAEAGPGAFLILDCLRPALDGLGMSEDKDAGRFLVGLDAFLAEAGATEALVVHHMGHAGERSRGDTRLRDWPDVEWRLVREAGDNGQAEPDARRYFSAYGRDVEVAEGLLTFDPDTRRLRYVGGNRQDAAAEGALPAVLGYLAENPGSSQRQVLAGVPKLSRADILKALDLGIERGTIDTMAGPKRALLHTLAIPKPP